MKLLFISFIFVSIIFLIIDLIWLSFSIRYFYMPNLKNIPLNQKPVMWAGVLFYVLYVIGLTLVILRPALNDFSVSTALWTGIIFGIVAYGTYNLTNMAFIKNWSINVVFVDMIWGGFVTGISSALTIFIVKNYFS